MYITRIAPSPTGKFHIGTARTAYFNWLAARASGGKFILRIDDTDTERNNEEDVALIYRTMQWLGLDHDITFRQSARIKLYQNFAKNLVKSKLAVKLPNEAIALIWNDRYGDSWEDEIAGVVPITKTNQEQIHERLILLRGHPANDSLPDKIGQPTYQFSSVVDDYLWGVNYIIRGKDHITNTAKQVAIWKALGSILTGAMKGVPLPKFAHVGLIMKDKKKISKRDGDTASLIAYKDNGYLPEALLATMLRWCWGGGRVPDVPLDRNKALEYFLEGNLKNVDASFDMAKLDYNNTFFKKLKGVRH